MITAALLELLEKADRAILIPSSDVPALEDALVELHGLIQRIVAQNAKAMETQSAMTEGHGPQDDSAVGNADLPEEPRS